MTKEYLEIVLTPPECTIRDLIANTRQNESINRGNRDQHGLEQGNRSPLECHILGVGGEIAASRALNVYWQPTVNTYKAPDLLENLQIRTRGRHDYDLLVRPYDKDEELFLLVTNSGVPGDPMYRVHGYLNGADAKQSKYKKDYGSRPSAFFVPCGDLKPLSSLIRIIIIAQAIHQVKTKPTLNDSQPSQLGK